MKINNPGIGYLDKLALAPIALFVYNRPWHTRQTVEALQKNKLAIDSNLFIFSDAAKNPETLEKVQKVREYIKTIKGFRSVNIVERKYNCGLAESIISGVTEIVNQFGKVIVLEDDLVTSSYFLTYMNCGLKFYYPDEHILSITGFSFTRNFINFPKNYNYDVYLHIRPMSWGWATWKNRWDGVDWNIMDFNNFIRDRKKIEQFNRGGTDLTKMLIYQVEKNIDSWYIRWAYHAFITNKYSVYPKISFVNNIGHDDTGVHCRKVNNNIFSHSELCDKDIQLSNDLQIDYAIMNKFNKAFNLKPISLLKHKLMLYKRP